MTRTCGCTACSGTCPNPIPEHLLGLAEGREIWCAECSGIADSIELMERTFLSFRKHMLTED